MIEYGYDHLRVVNLHRLALYDLKYHQLRNRVLQVIRRGPDTDFRTGSQEVLLTSFVFPSETGTFRIQTDRFAQVFCSQVHRNRKLVFTFATHQREEGK